MLTLVRDCASPTKSGNETRYRCRAPQDKRPTPKGRAFAFLCALSSRLLLTQIHAALGGALRLDAGAVGFGSHYGGAFGPTARKRHFDLCLIGDRKERATGQAHARRFTILFVFIHWWCRRLRPGGGAGQGDKDFALATRAIDSQRAACRCVAVLLGRHATERPRLSARRAGRGSGRRDPARLSERRARRSPGFRSAAGRGPRAGRRSRRAGAIRRWTATVEFRFLAQAIFNRWPATSAGCRACDRRGSRRGSGARSVAE